MGLISVIMGCESVLKRNNCALELLSYGYANYEKKDIVFEGTVITSIDDIRYKPTNFNIITSKSYTILRAKGEEDKNVSYKIGNSSGEKMIEVYYDNILVGSESMGYDEKVERRSFINLFFLIIESIVV